MDKRIKAKWVKALRSGKYEQGLHALRTDDGCYCVLGVLREVLYEEGTYTRSQLTGRGGHLSKRARLLCGLEEEEEITLALANDWDLLTFAEIALQIEEDL